MTRLAHDGYVESGFMIPRPSGRRLIGPYLNPGVTFTLCRSGARDVAAGTAIPDGPFGLGADRGFPDIMSELREDGRPILEGGSLVIRPEWRHSKRRIMVLLIASFIRLAGEISPDTYMVLVLHPRDTRFWRSVLGMETISPRSRELWSAPAELVMASWSHVISHLRSNDRRLAQVLLQAAVEPDPAWLTDARTGDGPPHEWFAPLADEDPEIRQLRESAAILDGVRAPSRA